MRPGGLFRVSGPVESRSFMEIQRIRPKDGSMNLREIVAAFRFFQVGPLSHYNSYKRIYGNNGHEGKEDFIEVVAEIGKPVHLFPE